MNTASGISRGNFKAIGPHTLTRSLANMPAGVISRLWGLRGPCMAGNTACATGLHSIGDAFRLSKLACIYFSLRFVILSIKLAYTYQLLG